MSRLSGRVSWMLAGMAIVVMMAQVAEAQREGGRRGRGGRGGMFGRSIPAIQLVAQADEVQSALNVTPEQKEKIEGINDELRDARREVMEGRPSRSTRQGFIAPRRTKSKSSTTRPPRNWRTCWKIIS